MSTGSVSERMPSGSMPRTTRVTKTEQPARSRIGAASSMVTATLPSSVDVGGSTVSAGSRNAAPVAAPYSLAMPRMESA